MTVDEAHIEFEITLDKRSTSQAPEMPAEVIDYFLNEAQARFVKTRYNKNNIYKAGFEENQKRTEDLRTLVVTEEIAVSSVDYEDDEYYQVDLSTTASQYWFYLRGRAQVTKDNCGATWTRVKVIQQDDLEKVKIDPFNKPTYTRPVIYFENGNILVISDGTFTVDSFKLTYLKEPAQVDSISNPQVEFDMPEHTHKEIVQLAADIAIENIESQRINTIKSQLLMTE
jgi:hypothetical protein